MGGGQMSELWYWRSNDRVRGPLVTEELEAVVLNQRLGDSDSVRLDGSDEWIPAPEIRRMFLQSSSASPAETAAKLLETAAARRLQASGGNAGSDGSGLLRRTAGAAGELAAHAVEMVIKSLQAATGWLGRRGRLIVTAVGGTVIVFFTIFWVISSWEPRDSSRLARVDEVWKLIQSSAGTNSPVPPEVSQQLESLERDLDASLRDEPVSGAAGSERQSSLARREMLYAVRAMRESLPNPDDAARDRIDKSLNAASDFVSGYSVTPQEPADPPGRWPKEIVAILVFDAVLAVIVGAWWVIGRGRG
jgi:hypothetical protein